MKQSGANPTFDMGIAPFLERQHPDAKKWARDRAKKLFAYILGAGLAGGQLPNQSDLSLLDQALVAAKQQTAAPVTPDTTKDTSDDFFKTYGMCRYNLNRFLCMCGRKEGQEDMLPD